jgi:hypothetical protein
METAAAFGFEDLLGVAIGAMAKAVCERNGEGPEQQFARSQAAVHMITDFLPRDSNEIIIAGHCVMMHEVMIDAVHDALVGETASIRRGARGQVIALNKGFNDDIALLERARMRPSEGRRDAPHPQETGMSGEPAGVQPEPHSELPAPAPRLMNRAARRQAARAEKRAAATRPRQQADATRTPPAASDHRLAQAASDHRLAQAASGHRLTPASCRPSREAMAACQANPDAMAALKAGDPARFARALGVEAPSEAFLAAAKTPGSPFDPESPGPWPPCAVPGPSKS